MSPDSSDSNPGAGVAGGLGGAVVTVAPGVGVAGAWAVGVAATAGLSPTGDGTVGIDGISEHPKKLRANSAQRTDAHAFARLPPAPVELAGAHLDSRNRSNPLNVPNPGPRVTAICLWIAASGHGATASGACASLKNRTPTAAVPFPRRFGAGAKIE